MSQNNYIVDLSRNEGRNITEISRLTGHSRTTVRNVLDGNYNQVKIYKKRGSILDSYKPIIDEWILNDIGVHYKQRHTAKRIYERLVTELEYPGKIRVVERYVSLKKKELFSDQKTYLSLKRPLIEAQIDFGSFDYYDGSKNVKKAHHLVIAFPSSNVEYTQVFKGENQQCLFEGMKRFFEYIGGVPKRIVFDNMTTAVSSIGKGKERTMTNDFMRFKNHYGFEPVFCNPASGNEKSHVEINVGYVRRNAFVPMPTITNFEQYNKSLFETCDTFNERSHYKLKKPLNQLFEQNKKLFSPLPQQPFVPTKLLKVKSNRNSYIRFENTYYSTHPKYVEQEMFIEVTHDLVRVLSNNYELIDEHKRDYDGEHAVVNWLNYLPLISKKPTALKYTGFYDSLDHVWKNTFNSIDSTSIQLILNEFGEQVVHGDPKLLTAVQQCLELQDVSIDSLKIIYRRLNDDIQMPLIEIPSHVPHINAYSSSASDYNHLMGA